MDRAILPPARAGQPAAFLLPLSSLRPLMTVFCFQQKWAKMGKNGLDFFCKVLQIFFGNFCGFDFFGAQFDPKLGQLQLKDL